MNHEACFGDPWWVHAASGTWPDTHKPCCSIHRALSILHPHLWDTESNPSQNPWQDTRFAVLGTAAIQLNVWRGPSDVRMKCAAEHPWRRVHVGTARQAGPHMSQQWTDPVPDNKTLPAARSNPCSNGGEVSQLMAPLAPEALAKGGKRKGHEAQREPLPSGGMHGAWVKVPT